jgi:competence protein ComEA
VLHFPSFRRFIPRALPFFTLGAITVIATTSCSSPGIEITVSTVDMSYAGTIYVGGDVKNPGIYPFNSDDTLGLIIDAAGGLKDESNSSQLELTVGDVPETQKININLADSWLLEALPGIGKVTAQKIIEYRTQHGLFLTISDILNVPGIGESTLELIEPYITVGAY